MQDILNKIKDSWEKGKFILIYDSDDREGEVDMVIPSINIQPKHIADLRVHAGGLICTALSYEIAEKIGLPYISDVYEKVSKDYPLLDGMSKHSLPYGARSSFSVSINHSNSFTGITDIDRAMTISAIGELCMKQEEFGTGLAQQFMNSFRLPGHVPLLIARDGLLSERQGHTELSIALCELLNLPQVVTMCEMMDANTYNALSTEDARKYAESNNYIFIDGSTIIDVWTHLKEQKEHQEY